MKGARAISIHRWRRRSLRRQNAEGEISPERLVGRGGRVMICLIAKELTAVTPIELLRGSAVDLQS